MRHIDNTLKELEKTIPPEILSMKIKDVKNFKGFIDFTDIMIGEKMSRLDILVSSVVKTQAKKDDEAFITKPGPRKVMLNQSYVTPVNKNLNRLPNKIVQKRKAASAENLSTINLKANPLDSLSILRHARSGEAVFALSGSPIVVSNVHDQGSSIKIPVPNGILSVRSNLMNPSNFDSSLVHQIEQPTWNDLLTLKANLDLRNQQNKQCCAK